MDFWESPETTYQAKVFEGLDFDTQNVGLGRWGFYGSLYPAPASRNAGIHFFGKSSPQLIASISTSTEAVGMLLVKESEM